MDVCLVSGRHLTVFNSQSLLQVGGRWSEYKQTLDMPFQVQDIVNMYVCKQTFFHCFKRFDLRSSFRNSLKSICSFIFLWQGVLTGISYNGMRPLDMAHQKSQHTMMRGVLTPLTSIPYDYKVNKCESVLVLIMNISRQETLNCLWILGLRAHQGCSVMMAQVIHDICIFLKKV